MTRKQRIEKGDARKTTQQIVITISKELRDEINNHAKAVGAIRSQVYENRLLRGIRCVKSGCGHVNEIFIGLKQDYKGRSKELKSVCIHISNRLYNDIIKASEFRCLSMYCFALLETVSCDCEHQRKPCTMIEMERNEFTVPEFDEELKQPSQLDILRKEKYDAETEKNIASAFLGKPILPKEAGNHEQN